MDLLGSTDVGMTMSTVTTKNAPPPATSVNNNDLLDLLGSLDMNTGASPLVLPQQSQLTTQIFNPTSTTNFLVDGLLNSSAQIGLYS